MTLHDTRAMAYRVRILSGTDYDCVKDLPVIPVKGQFIDFGDVEKEVAKSIVMANVNELYHAVIWLKG